jgi:hypothetical protein
MTLKELKGKYARLSDEVDVLATDGVGNEARLLRLMNDLDQVHRELSELRRRTFHAPTLRDAVALPVLTCAVTAAPQAMPVVPAPALSMAG